MTTEDFLIRMQAFWCTLMHEPRGKCGHLRRYPPIVLGLGLRFLKASMIRGFFKGFRALGVGPKL